MSKKIIIVKDKMQNNYKYILSEPLGKNFDSTFKPDLTPKQMLKLGIFGGKYLRDCRAEFPKDWFIFAKLLPLGKNIPDKNLNYFKVNASLSLTDWQNKGWINEEDPRGWFQWYCRYYMGRRSKDDQRQIKRWKAMTRHVSQINKNCRIKDEFCRPKQRQALLHWAYDSRKI